MEFRPDMTNQELAFLGALYLEEIRQTVEWIEESFRYRFRRPHTAFDTNPIAPAVIYGFQHVMERIKKTEPIVMEFKKRCNWEWGEEP